MDYAELFWGLPESQRIMLEKLAVLETKPKTVTNQKRYDEYVKTLQSLGWAMVNVQALIQTAKTETQKMKNNIVYPYNNFSKSAKALALALGFQRVRRELALSAFEKGLVPGKYNIINWGSFAIPVPHNSKDVEVRVINSPEIVKKCSHKLTCFKELQGKVRIPEFTTTLSEALAWVKAGESVLGRHDRGSQGIDICFYEDGIDKFNSSEFWSKYKKKKEEYRVHVIGGSVILVQQKVLRTTDDEGNKIDTSRADYRIRNLANGFIFKRYDINPPSDVIEQAEKAIETLKLDFGAVDVIYNAYESKAYVLEINTAPGLEGTTVQDYAEAFKNKFFT